MGESSAPHSEILFAQLIVEQGFARAEHVRECLGLIGSLAARHVSPLPRLSQLLLEKGYISPRQLEMTLRLPPRALAGGAPPAPSPSSAAQLPPEVAEAAESPASRVGKYIRVRALGSGGMGEVWSAWDTELRRWVALKILTSQNREEIARFEREAQTAAKLSHPNIATVYDVGEEGGRPFIAMQLVRGRTLAVFPRDHPRGLIEFVRQAALAVHYAHEQGVVHRDLKPHNIMIEGDLERRQHPSELRVYVMDFGLAKQATADSALSVSGTILGTPSYMPPEQARGLLNQIDARSDVYALGATLYELLTNRPPFKHENVYELLKQVVDEEPRAPRKINPLVDPDLETVVLRCLEKDPRRRYPSARDLADELGRYLAGDPVVARPASVVYRARKWVGRRKALAIAVSAAILAAAAVAGILAEGAFDRARESRELHQVAAASAGLGDALGAAAIVVGDEEAHARPAPRSPSRRAAGRSCARPAPGPRSGTPAVRRRCAACPRPGRRAAPRRSARSTRCPRRRGAAARAR